MTTFELALTFVLNAEGGASHHPDDDGGETVWGISRVAHADIPWPPTQAQAAAIYQRDYWGPIRGADLPPGLALALLDGAVQHGPVDAIRMLQRALGRGVTVDGRIGPETIAAAKTAALAPLLVDYCTARALHYAAHADWPTFGRGWIRRLFQCYAAALRLGA